MTCIKCKYFSMKMVCYGNEPFEACECLKGNEEINENTDICEEFELMEKKQMTEQEIVNILKENKTKGVALGFMPNEVQDWCEAHKDDLLLYSIHEDWRELKNYGKAAFNKPSIFALPDDYQVKEEQKGEWVEFEIKDSCFAYSHSVGTSHLFDWFDWSFFLKASKKQGWGFTAFGGWQYEGDDGWFMATCVSNDNRNYWNYMNEECKPAIPIKIRFWKAKQSS